MLRTLEPQKGAENKNAEADFKNPCSYKMKSVYQKCYIGDTLIAKANLEIFIIVAVHQQLHSHCIDIGS